MYCWQKVLSPLGIFLFFVLGIRALASESSSVFAKPQDLAIILPAKSEDYVAFDPRIFPDLWWDALAQGYAKTAIGPDFLAESPKEDWRLVAIRFAPCQPLLPFLTPLNQLLCHPELRLVWQPIHLTVSDQVVSASADDRAIHALYRFDPESFLSEEDARTWNTLKQKALHLSDEEIKTFGNLQYQFASKILESLVLLRKTKDDLWNEEVLSERSEFQNPQLAREFLESLRLFLYTHATPQSLTQLTSFSLPAGRVPAKLNQWVFLAFEPENRGRFLVPQKLTVKSRRDGRLLADYGYSASVTMKSEESQLFEKLSHLDPETADELKEAVIWSPRDRRLKSTTIADPSLTHIAHTSCASCHRLQKPLFNLHNLSYFQSGKLSISPRVYADLKRELDWLNRN